MKYWILLLVLMAYSIGCAQTTKIRARWDKSADIGVGVSHYELFLVALPDSALFWSPDLNWPADTTGHWNWNNNPNIFNYHLATVAHIENGIDTTYYEWNQRSNHQWIRAYIFAEDSAGNRSALVPSINVTFLPDEIPPDKILELYLFRNE